MRDDLRKLRENLTDEQRPVFDALAWGPKTTEEMKVVNHRFSARLKEIRDDHGIPWSKRKHGGSFLYSLDGQGGIPGTGRRPSLRSIPSSDGFKLPEGPWFNVCDREPCGQRWKSDASPEKCPSCLAPVQWISSFTFKGDADNHLPLFQQDRLAEKAAA